MHLAIPAPSVDVTPVVAIGPSPRMKAVYDFLHAIEGSDSTVLITGESGTGKEVIARRIHERSRRRHRPFVAVSCALFSETLIESELFGHERGAFTGAIGDRHGRFELADGGTLFLDDIDDVPVSMQVKLLRVLQNRTIERVGGTRTLSVNVRILAASKKDLREMVASGAFREDLYYRLNVVPIALPPLRARPEDIPTLMDHFLSRYFRQRGDDIPPMTEGVRLAFQQYSWPGNVRELENACERIAQTLICDQIRSGCVAASVLFGAADRLWPQPVGGEATLVQPPAIVEAQAERPSQRSSAVNAIPGNLATPPLGTSLAEGSPTASSRGPQTTASLGTAGLSLDAQLLQFEARLIRAALEASAGNKTQAAALLKIGRSTLGDRIKRCQIEPARISEQLAAVSQGSLNPDAAAEVPCDGTGHHDDGNDTQRAHGTADQAQNLLSEILVS